MTIETDTNTSALDDVIDGRPLYATASAAVGEVVDEAEGAAGAHETLALRVHNLVVREEHRERHIRKMDELLAEAEKREVDHRDRQLEMEAYVRVLAEEIAAPTFEEWQAARRAPKAALVAPVDG
jgi:hypothetical protein